LRSESEKAGPKAPLQLRWSTRPAAAELKMQTTPTALDEMKRRLPAK
jgi:hypothetical protein